MKKFYFIAIITAVLLVLPVFSWPKIKAATPSLSLESVDIASFDLDGITFNCNYSIENPYPVEFSIKQVVANVLCSGNTVTQINTSQGAKVSAMGSKSNTLTFKISYESILNFAKNFPGKESLPFSLDGSASLDLSKIPLLDNQSLSLPFQKDFEVPVSRP